MDGRDGCAEPDKDATRVGELLREVLGALDCNYMVFDADRQLVDHSRSYFELHRPIFAAFGHADYSPAWQAGARPVRYDDLTLGAIRRSAPDAMPAEVAAELARRVAFHESNHGDPGVRAALPRPPPDARFQAPAERQTGGRDRAGISRS